MEIFLFCTMIAIFGIGFGVGQFYMYIRDYDLWQENQQLKQMLEDMQHVEEISYRAYCAMTREAVRKQQQSQLALGQKTNLNDLFLQRKIVLVPLNRGLVGGETARLLGSLIVGLTWTLALSRASIPPERRHIVSVYIDELQDYLSLPTDLSDALAQARGLGVGMTLAHQYRNQLPTEIRAGIDANARNKIVFGLNAKDAKDMAAMAPELTAEDFMALPRYQIYTSFQHGDRNTGWVRGKTLPPTPALRDPVELRALSMETYGVPAEDVEAEYLKMFASSSVTSPNPGDAPIGRRKR